MRCLRHGGLEADIFACQTVLGDVLLDPPDGARGFCSARDLGLMLQLLDRNAKSLIAIPMHPPLPRFVARHAKVLRLANLQEYGLQSLKAQPEGIEAPIRGAAG